METTEKIVEAYVRYVKGWATIPNLRCAGQKAIDLFAIDPLTDDRWHIETSVSISGGFSALTNASYEPGEYKQRTKQAGARRKLGFFLAEKFEPPAVLEKLALYGCDSTNVRRAIVTWDWKPGVQEQAENHGIELWSFPALMRKIAELGKNEKSYFSDDTLRTIMLFVKGAEAEVKRLAKATPPQPAPPISPTPGSGADAAESFYIYENWTHKRARLHRGSCSFCKHGSGSQAATGIANGRWLKPYSTLDEALTRLKEMSYSNKGVCPACLKGAHAVDVPAPLSSSGPQQ